MPITETVPTPATECSLDWPAERVRALAVSVAEMADADCRFEDRWCELFAGVLVEKPMGYAEAMVQTELGCIVGNYLHGRRLGLLTGVDGPLNFGNSNVFLPDLAFVPWERCPNRRRPVGTVANLIPTLVAEVLSDSNTVAEMVRKRKVYITAGVRFVWEIDIQVRTVAIYTRADAPDTTLTRTDTLDCSTELPGFTLALADLFAVLDEEGVGAAE